MIKHVNVIRVPESVSQRQVPAFLEEVRPLLEKDCPQLIFDLSLVRRIDAAGIGMLFYCMEEAARRHGDLKLASMSPQARVVLDLTRTGRFFETFASSIDAARSFSFSGYLPNMVWQFQPRPDVKKRGESKAA